ncbi:MAG: hypothetical protein HY679_09125 [Chloroflexi bacterium]|nr:hypothetical protein [Chloroflexota bacterium]
MKRLITWIFIAVAIVAAIVVAALVLRKPTPALVVGDPWDYALTLSDLSPKWEVSNSEIQTAYDVAQPAVPAATADPVSNPSSQSGLQKIYFIDFTNQTASDIFFISSQVVIYDTPQSAQAALAAEAPGQEWEKFTPSQTIGDGTIAWHLLPKEDAPQQAAYRVDFRYLNAIGSVGVTGTNETIVDDKQAQAYAVKVFDKMKKAAQPEALKLLVDGGQPDLRPLLLTQSELAGLDPNVGRPWTYDSRLLPAWTPNSALSDPQGVARFGRLMGYQVYMIKLLGPDDTHAIFSGGLLQQVTAYAQADKAQQILEHMAGLEIGPWPTPPQVGDSARGWSDTLHPQEAPSQTVAVTEIDFRVGTYIASIRLQTLPLTAAEIADAGEANRQLARKLALALADKLRAQTR